MVNLRPHILKWRTADGEATKDENGDVVVGAPGVEMEVPCRFHLLSAKEIANQQSSPVKYSGLIRLNTGVELPAVGTQITVVEGEIIHYSGLVKDIFRGQLSYRIDV